jgi:hypothetical protein
MQHQPHCSSLLLIVFNARLSTAKCLSSDRPRTPKMQRLQPRFTALACCRKDHQSAQVARLYVRDVKVTPWGEGGVPADFCKPLRRHHDALVESADVFDIEMTSHATTNKVCCRAKGLKQVVRDKGGTDVPFIPPLPQSEVSSIPNGDIWKLGG